MTPIVIPAFVTKEFILAHPNWIFVFGKAIDGEKGNFGQASVCLGLQNCYGWPTKHTPCMAETAFFKNTDFEYETITELWKLKTAQLTRLRKVYPADAIIALPKIGTGGAQLHKRCPKLYDALIETLKQCTDACVVDYSIR